MNLKIEAIPNRNGPGEEIAIYGDTDALLALSHALLQAVQSSTGAAFEAVGFHNVHVYRTSEGVDNLSDL